MKIGIKSLGCPKNLVDSEVICGILQKNNHQICSNVDEVDVLIINTCSFIQDAVEESLEEIFEAIKLKEEGRIKGLVVAGCLPQRYFKNHLKQEIPEVDAFIGVGDLIKINQVIDNIFIKNKKIDYISSVPTFLYNSTFPRFTITPLPYAYIKIAEGCDNNCSYCLIPKIRGKYRSRKIEDIIKEVEIISQKQKLREIILIAQDTTKYGWDIYGDLKLAELLKRISSLPLKDLKWIRLLYTHPAHYTPQLIEVIGESSKIVPYLDLPLQHINDEILGKMNRTVSRKEILTLIKRLRKEIPQLVLRSTFMVGFPGEDKQKFTELINFIKEVRWEKLGAFIFSPEEGTPAYRFTPRIPKKKKLERLEKLMLVQQEISREINQTYLGKEIEVLVEEATKEKSGFILGRSAFDAPEIDGKVIIKSDKLKIGEMIKVKITSTLEYDLIGEPIEEDNKVINY